jgi:gliding motility-associated-like protein
MKKNFLRPNSFLFSILLAVICCSNLQAAIITATATGNWSSPAIWSSGAVPTSTDDVIIAGGRTVTVNGIYTANSLLIGSATTSLNTLQFNTGASLMLTSTVTIVPPTGAGSNSLSIGNGYMLCTGLFSTNSGANGNMCSISINTGTLDVNGIATLGATALRNDFIFFGAGLFRVSGAFTGGGAITSALGNVEYYGTTQTVNTLFTNYNNLTLSNSATKLSTSSYTVNNSLTIQGSTTFSTSASFTTTNLSILGTARLDASGMATGTIGLNGTWSVTSANANPFAEGTSSVIVSGTSTQTISTVLVAGETFNRLTIANTSGLNPAVVFLSNINTTEDFDHIAGIVDLRGNPLSCVGANAAAQTFNLAGARIMSSLAGSSVSISQGTSALSVNYSAYQIGDATIGIPVNMSSNNSTWENSTFYGTTSFIKTGTNNQTMGGGNTFFGPSTFSTTPTSARWRMGDDGAGTALPDTYYNGTFIHNGTSNFIVSCNNNSHFYGTTTFSSSTAGGVYVTRSNGTAGNYTATIHGPVFANVSLTGSIIFADAAASFSNTVNFESTIQVNSAAGSSGDVSFGSGSLAKINLTSTAQFIPGTLSGLTSINLRNVTQTGSLLQSMSGPTNAKLFCGTGSLTPCVFNGPATFNFDTLSVAYSTFNNNVTFTGRGFHSSQFSDYNGSTNSFARVGTVTATCSYAGGNTFIAGSSSTFSSSSSGTWSICTVTADDYNGDVSFVQTGVGALQPASNANCTFAGNISTLGTATAITFGVGGSGRVTIDGNSSQTIIALASLKPTITRLTINTTGAGSLTLNAPVDISTNLTMTNGIVNTSATNSLTLLTGATTNIGNSTSYVNGPLYENINSTATQTLTFPVGKLPNWRPVVLAARNSTATNVTYKAEVTNSSAQALGYTLPTGVNGVSAYNYWDIDRTLTSTGAALPTQSITGTQTVTLYYLAADGVSSPTNLTICKNTSTATTTWINIGGAGATAGAGSVVSTSTPSVFTTYSRFALAHTSLSLTASASSTAICSGATATLTAGGSSSYTWNPGGIVSSSIAVSPTATTIYTVSGIGELGSTVTRTVNLLVNPQPTVTAVSSSTAICIGATATLTAGGANTYTWTSGPTTSQYTVNTTGTYTVTGTNTVTGCTNTRTVSLLVNPLPVVTAMASSTAICIGTTATLTAGGANTYTWTSGPTASQYTVNTTGTYTVTGTNTVTGCINTQTVSLLVNPLPTITAFSSSTAICAGATATLTAGGANTYTWTSGPTTQQYTVNTTGTYTVTGTNTVTGCTNTRTVSLLVNPLPVVTAVSSSTAICIGATATLTAGGANTYTWTSGPTASQYTVNITGTYTVTGTNTLTGCTDTRTVSLLVNPLPVVTAVASSTAICIGATATLTAGGANTYTWTSGPATQQYTVNTTGTYTVTGTNTVTGCTNTRTVSLLVNPLPIVTAVSSNSAICNGITTTLTAGGANTYTWTSGPTTSQYTVNLPGTYTVTGTNTLTGCTNTRTVNIIANPSPTITAIASSTAICAGATATLTAGGGNTYTWTSGPATQQYTVNTTGTYTVTGTNTVTGCINTRTVSLLVNPLPVVTAVASSTAICIGTTATLTAGGANTYTWTSGPATQQYTVNTTGTYTVTGTNTVTGCTNTRTVSLLVNPLPTITAVSSSTAICAGATATLTAGGANTYTWTSGPATQQYTVNTTGTYTATGTNTVTGCTNTRTVSLLVNPLPVVTAVSSSTAICIGATATLTAGGANTYTWTSGPTASQYTVNSTGTYTVTGTNTITGCINTRTVSLLVNPLPLVTAVSSSTAICIGTTATLTAGGANTYTWTSGPIALQYTVNTTGTYTVTGTDINGCVNANTVDLLVNPLPNVTAVTSSAAICSGFTATLTAGGANTYTWTSGPVSPNYVVNTTDTYTVTGTDVNGCVNTNTVNLLVNPLPNVTAVSSSTAICIGATATLTAGGANTYTWTSGPVSSNYVVNTTDTYTVTGTDVNGCVNSNTVNLLVNPLPNVTAVTSSSAICLGFTATLIAGGANTYTWTSGPVSPNYVVNTTDTYTVTGTDANGCVNTNTVNLLVNPLPNVTAVTSSSAICSGFTATLTAGGANTYTWTSGLVSPNYVVNTTDTYTVTGTDVNGCVNTNTVNLLVNPLPSVTAVTSSSAICSGFTATLTAGGTNTYTWTSGPVLPNYVVNTTDTYTVTGTDVNGCVNTNTVNLLVNPLPNVTAVTSSSAICSGFTATLTAGGANTYTWTSGSVSPNYVVNTTGIYTVSGSDANNCVNTETVSLIVNSLPVLTLSPVSTSICAGFNTTLTATGANTYNWTNGVTSSINIVSSLTNTTIGVIGTNQLTGCISNSSAVNIAVVQIPTVTAFVNSTEVCSNSSITLSGNFGTAVSYTWSGSGINTTNENVSNPQFNLPVAGTYTYNLIGSNSGCLSSSASVVVTVIAAPSSSLQVASIQLCQGNTVSVNIANPQVGVLYTWSIGTFSANGSAYIVPSSVTNASGSYSLFANALLVTTSNVTCQTTSIGNILVNSLPLVSVTSPSINTCQGENLTLDVQSQSGLIYTWMRADSISYVGSFYPLNDVKTSQSGIYTVTAVDGNGCASSDTLSLLVEDCEINIPQLLSPNGDGKNDYLIIRNIDLYPNHRVQIYNRWGNVVFDRQGYNNDWQGKNETGNGGLLPVGTYFISVDFGDKSKKNYKGYIQLEY